MLNAFLILILTGFLFLIIWKGTSYFDRIDRKEKAKERAQNRYRWSNGRFAKGKTYSDLQREVKAELA